MGPGEGGHHGERVGQTLAGRGAVHEGQGGRGAHEEGGGADEGHGRGHHQVAAEGHARGVADAIAGLEGVLTVLKFVPQW